MNRIKTIVIVESPFDEVFIKLLLKHNQLTDFHINSIDTFAIEHLHYVDGTNSRGKSALDRKIERLKGELRFEPYDKVEHVSIILDADSPPDGGVLNSLQLVNNAIGNKLGVYPNFSHEGEHKKIQANCDGEHISITVSCFFIKLLNGKGHLDLLLKAIASRSMDVPYCLCLDEQLLPCMKERGENVNDYEKLWINHYLRHFASKKQLNHANEKLRDVISEKGDKIFDLDSEILFNLKNYLKSLL